MGYSNVLPAWLFLPDNNKGKKMNEKLETEYAQAFKDEVKIKYNEHGNPIVPTVSEPATMEFKTETVKNEG